MPRIWFLSASDAEHLTARAKQRFGEHGATTFDPGFPVPAGTYQMRQPFGVVGVGFVQLHIECLFGVARIETDHRSRSNSPQKCRLKNPQVIVSPLPGHALGRGDVSSAIGRDLGPDRCAAIRTRAWSASSKMRRRLAAEPAEAHAASPSRPYSRLHSRPPGVRATVGVRSEPTRSDRTQRSTTDRPHSRRSRPWLPILMRSSHCNNLYPAGTKNRQVSPVSA